MSNTTSAPPSFWARHGRMVLLLVVVTGIMFYLWGNVNWHIPPADRWDGWHYRTMAEAAPGLSATAAAPFRYRVLGTYTIGLLAGANYIAGFFILNYAALLALVIALYLFLCRVGIRQPVAAFTAALLTMNTHLFGLTSWLTFHTNDSLGLLFLLLSLWAGMDRRWGWFGLTLVLGALSRETWVVGPPAVLVYLWQQGTLRRDGPRWLLAVLPAVVVTVLLRIFLHAEVRGSLEPMQALLRFGPKILQPEFWARQFANSLKPLSFLPLIFLPTTWRWLREQPWMAVLIVLTFFSSLLGSANERLMAPAITAFYWLLAVIIQQHLWSHRTAMAVITAATFAATLHYWYARFPLPSRELTFVIGGVAWAAATLPALAVWFQQRRTPVAASSPPPSS